MKILLPYRLLHSEPAAPAASTPPVDTGDVIQPPVEPTPGDEVDFSAMAKDMELDNETDVIDPPDPDSSAPAPVVAPAPVTPVPQPVAAVQPVTPAPGASSPPPAAPTAVTPPPQAASPQAPAPQAPSTPEPITPEKVEASYAEYQKNILPQLEKHYTLTPEQVTEVNENPAVAIPKLMARVHLQSQISAYTGVMSQMPRVVGMVLDRFDAVRKAEGEFHGRWPMLADPKHQSIVDMTLKTFRAANPQMPTKDMIEKAGMMIMLSLGLDPTPPQQQQQVVSNQQPVVPPMRPAGNGAAPPVNTRGAGNIFEKMAEDWNNDESP